MQYYTFSNSVKTKKQRYTKFHTKPSTIYTTAIKRIEALISG